MLTVRILGAGSGRPGARRDTTSLLIEAPGSRTLVDCPGGVVHKLARLSLEPEDLDRVVVTHDHVDHVYGFAHLVHSMAIGGQGRALRVHAPDATIGTLRGMVQLHGLEGPGYPVLEWQPVVASDDTLVLQDDAVRITATVMEHSRVTLGLRVATDDAVFGHTSDTWYAPARAPFFRAADLLLHDCAGLHAERARFASAHSSAREAGEFARLAGARRLGLIHLGAMTADEEADLEREAGTHFGAAVAAVGDNDVWHLGRAEPA